MIRAGVTENNFQGKGQQLGLDVGVSQRTSDYNISFTEPYFLGRRLSAGADLFRTEQDYQDEGSYDSETTGGRIRLGWNYTDDLSQYARYTLRQDKSATWIRWLRFTLRKRPVLLRLRPSDRRWFMTSATARLIRKRAIICHSAMMLPV